MTGTGTGTGRGGAPGGAEALPLLLLAPGCTMPGFMD